MRKLPYKTQDNKVVFYYLRASEIWPDKSGSGHKERLLCIVHCTFNLFNKLKE